YEARSPWGWMAITLTLEGIRNEQQRLAVRFYEEGKNQTDTAALLGVVQSTVSEWLRNIGVDTAKRLSEADIELIIEMLAQGELRPGSSRSLLQVRARPALCFLRAIPHAAHVATSPAVSSSGVVLVAAGPHGFFIAAHVACSVASLPA